MAELLRMPEVAANTTEAVLSSWPLPEGTTFSRDDVVATVETAKAVVDVAAEADGVLLRQLVTAGTEVGVGEAIALIGAPGEQVDDADEVLRALGAVPAATTAAPPPGPERVAPAIAAAANGRGRVFASPLARRLAKQAGLSVEQIDGTGPNGRVLRRDVERALAATQVPTSRAAASAQPAAAAFVDVPHSRLRRAIATALSHSKQNAPHFYVRATARVDRLLALREEINEGAEVRVSVNDLVVKAVAAAHVAVPELNVVWTPDAVRRFSSVDVSVAVATDDGLVTPVLRGVEQMSVSAVARTTRELAQRARAGRLQQGELEGGTISVTNLGMFGTEEFAAIINPPQASTLAVGAARQEPVVVDGRVEVTTVLRLTLSVDHRPVDGVVAARWMAELTRLLEHPARILA